MNDRHNSNDLCAVHFMRGVGNFEHNRGGQHSHWLICTNKCYNAVNAANERGIVVDDVSLSKQNDGKCVFLMPVSAQTIEGEKLTVPVRYSSRA